MSAIILNCESYCVFLKKLSLQLLSSTYCTKTEFSIRLIKLTLFLLFLALVSCCKSFLDSRVMVPFVSCRRQTDSLCPLSWDHWKVVSSLSSSFWDWICIYPLSPNSQKDNIYNSLMLMLRLKVTKRIEILSWRTLKLFK